MINLQIFRLALWLHQDNDDKEEQEEVFPPIGQEEHLLLRDHGVVTV